MNLIPLLFLTLGALVSCSKKVDEPQAVPAVSTAAAAQLYFEVEGVLYVANLDGSNPKKIFTGNDPAPFSNAEKVAYTFYTPQGGRQLAMYDRTTKTNKLLTIVVGDNNYGPAVSPNQQRLAFNHHSDKNWAIAVVDTAGTELNVITEPTGNYSPAWNSTGDVVYYHNMDTLFSYTLASKARAPIVDLKALFPMKASSSSAMRIATAENDRYIIFDADGETSAGDYEHPWATIFSYDTQTRALKRISPDNVFAAAPYVAPGGKTIYFSGFEAKDITPGKGDEESVVELYVYSMDLDGKNLRRICKGGRPTVR